MEYIPARHAAKVGTMCPAEVTGVSPSAVTLELDLTRIAPGRSPFLGAGLLFHRTVDSKKARRLQTGDVETVVLIDVAVADDFVWLQASLPADPAWLTWNDQTVRRLARHIRETGETHLLPVLADALEDAGCADAALLDHCREPHDPGTRSWAVELLATQE